MTAAVVVFPGSNCDRDLAVAIESIMGRKPNMVWHGDTELPAGTDLIALPGGFPTAIICGRARWRRGRR